MDPDQPPGLPTAKVFTVGEASALLADVRPIVRRMRDASAAAAKAGEVVRAFADRMAETGGGRPDPGEAQGQRDLADATSELRDALEELDERGVRVKDPFSGLVDVLYDRHGELVELCWLDGEDEIAHWHRIGHGFAGRRPLDEDMR